MELSKDEIIKLEIVEQARQLFGHYGFEKTAMNDIAKACGRAKSTVYHYFESKDEIFEAVLRLEGFEIFKKYQSSIKPEFSASDKLKCYVATLIFEARLKINFSTILKEDFANRLGDTMFLKQLDFQKKHLKMIIQEGIENGEFLEVSEQQIDWLSEVFISGVFGMIIYFVFGQNTNDVLEKLDLVSDIFLNGFKKK